MMHTNVARLLRCTQAEATILDWTQVHLLFSEVSCCRLQSRSYTLFQAAPPSIKSQGACQSCTALFIVMNTKKHHWWIQSCLLKDVYSHLTLVNYKYVLMQSGGRQPTIQCCNLRSVFFPQYISNKEEIMVNQICLHCLDL